MLCKSVHGVQQAPQCQHKLVLDWMIVCDYLLINNEMTMYRKKDEGRRIDHPQLVVDYMKQIM